MASITLFLSTNRIFLKAPQSTISCKSAKLNYLKIAILKSPSVLDNIWRGPDGAPVIRYNWSACHSYMLYVHVIHTVWVPAKDIDGVLVEEVPCSVLSMDFFDVLWKSGVVRESGSIVKCFDEPCGDFLISDRLREVRLCGVCAFSVISWTICSACCKRSPNFTAPSASLSDRS